MVISFREKTSSVEEARYRAQRAMRIAFFILLTVVTIYIISFALVIAQSTAEEAYAKNISALAVTAKYVSGVWMDLMEIIITIFAIVTSFFGVFLGFREACVGLAMNVLKRQTSAKPINRKRVSRRVTIFIVLVAWTAIIIEVPVLDLTSICSPIFGLVGCLIPAFLVYRVPQLHKYKGVATVIIIIAGILLCISPFLAL
jgi:amino acid permease